MKLSLLNSHGDIAVRKMEVTTVVEDKSWQAVHVEPANSLVVTMIQLTSWPEQGLPHPTSITSLADHLTNAQMRSSTKQTVVMCKYDHCISFYIQTPLILSGAYEGRSVQLHGTAFEIAILPFYGHILKWGVSVVFIANALTPHASRLRYTARRTQAYVRVYTALARGDSKLRFTITAMEQEREGEIERLRKRQATTPHRPAKRSRLLEAKLRSKTVYRPPPPPPPPQMTAQLGHFQLLTPRGNSKRVYSTGGSGQTIRRALVGSH